MVVGILERLVRGLLCVTVFLMMAITAVDVFARYVVNTPLRGAFEIVTLLLAVSIFLALPSVTRAGEHISVDLAQPLFGAVARTIQKIGIYSVSGVVLAIVTFQMWRHAQLLDHGGRVTGFLEWPLAPLAYAMSVMCGITALVYLVLLVEATPLPRVARAVFRPRAQ